MSELTLFTKDPDAVLDYSWDWSTWLGDDTITSQTVTAATGITVDGASLSGDVVTAWLSGGTAGTTYEVTCRIVTIGGRTDDRTSRIYVTER